MKIYEYNELIDTLLNTDEIDEETGIVFDVTLLDRLEMERKEKLENLLLYTAQLEADAKEMKEYSDTIAVRAKSRESRAKSLKTWLIDELTRYGDKKFETTKIKAIVSTRSKVDVTDESLLPSQYIRTTTKSEPDKTAIGAALKLGATIDGARLIESRSLQIK